MKRFAQCTVILVILAGFFVSCTDFFTSSWGEGLKRDPSSYIKNVSASNAKDMAKELKADPDASKELLHVIAKKGGSNPELQAAGLMAANNAAELGTTLLSNVGTLLDTLDVDDPDETEIQEALSEILEKLPNVTGIANDIEKMLASTTGNATDGYTNGIGSSATPDDIIMGALILVLGDFQSTGSGTISDYINEIADDFDDIDDETDLSTLSSKLQTAYKLLMSIEDKDGLVGDLLEGLGISI
jgi:hypothetical protein